jgi:hypothetical protein
VSRIAVVLAAATVLSSTPALARDVAGVDVAEALTYEGKALKLNGAGIRKKVVVKVYVGALYLESTSTSADAIVKSDQAKVVRMVFLRDVDKGKILDAYKEGFERNSKGDLAKLQPALDKLGAMSDMKSGQWLQVAYAPGKGVTVTQQSGGSIHITADAKLVSDALLRNWIGGEPADGGLKAAMLAGK